MNRDRGPTCLYGYQNLKDCQPAIPHVDGTGRPGRTRLAAFVFILLLGSAAFADSTVFEEAFELQWESGWSVDTQNIWGIGEATFGPEGAQAGSGIAGTVLDGEYPGNTNSRLSSPEVTLPEISDNELLKLRFWQWYAYSNYDSGQVQISVYDSRYNYWGGWRTITKVENAYPAWTQTNLDISEYAGETIRLGFNHATSSVGNKADSVGWYIDSIEIVRHVRKTVFPVGFEEGPGDWSWDKGLWEIGAPSFGPGEAHTGRAVAGTVLADEYPANVNGRLVSPDFTLPTVLDNEHLKLRFWQWYAYSNFDSGRVQISVYNRQIGMWGGWNTLAKAEGAYQQWSQSNLDISVYAGETVRLGFSHQAYSFGPEEGSIGWYIDDIQIWKGVQTAIFPEGFESGPGGWSWDIGLWGVGEPLSGPGHAHGGSQVAGISLSGNYPANVNSRLTSPKVVLPAIQDDEQIYLSFWQWYRYAHLDSGRVQLSVYNEDIGFWGGWVTLAEVDNARTSWSDAKLDISDYAGEIVRISFYHRAHNFGDTEDSVGWYIDDVDIYKEAQTTTFPEDFESGPGGWSWDIDLWEIGAPLFGPEGAHSGSSVVGVVLSGEYPATTNSRLVSPRITLPATSENEHLKLRYWQWYSYSFLDSGKVQLSVYNEAWGSWGQWTTLATVRNSYPVWTMANLDISEYAGETVRLAFYHQTSSAGEKLNSVGWYIDDIDIWKGVGTTGMPEGFESGSGGWSWDVGLWEIGEPFSGPAKAHSGGKVVGTVLSGDYPEETNSRLVSPEIVLPDSAPGESVECRFWQWYGYSDFDSGKFQVSVHDSATGRWNSWVTLASVSGLYPVWSRASVDLSDYAGQTIRLGFKHETSSTGEKTDSIGWYIDDVSIWQGYSTVTLLQQDAQAHFTAIQSAIEEAEDGGVILVPPGTYLELIDFRGKDIEVRSSHVGQAILDGQGHDVVWFRNGETPQAVLKGFTVTSGGAGITCAGSSPTIQNCIISNHERDGIFVLESAGPRISNCTIVNNARSGVLAASAVPEITNSIFWQNSADLVDCHATFSRVQSPEDAGLGNLVHDPQFVDAETHDYHVRSGSLCIDAGAIWSEYPLEPVPNGLRVNLGAYGNTSEATITIDTDDDGLPDAWERFWWPDDLLLSHGPQDNPDQDAFTVKSEHLFGYDPTTRTDASLIIPHMDNSPAQADPLSGDSFTIEYVVNSDSAVTIDICTAGSNSVVRQLPLLGRAGINTVAWDCTNNSGNIVPNGFYDVVIKAGLTAQPSVSRRSPRGRVTEPGTWSHVVATENSDPYKNAPVAIDFEMTDWGRLMMRVLRADAPFDEVVRLMDNDRILPPGVHTHLWNGRNAIGQVYEGTFSVHFDVPKAVTTGALLVWACPPEITNLLCNQYRIIPTYGEITTISYQLTQDAIVTLNIKDPDGSHFTTLFEADSQTAGAWELTWDGTDDMGQYVSLEGVYGVEVIVEHPDHPAFNSTTTGAITVYR